MNEQTAVIPPWHSGTRLFDQPDATCELVLDGRKYSVSIIVWEDYCYLRLSDLNGLWAITRPYDQTNLPEFVANHIEQGEVGRVWDFSYQPPSTLSFRSAKTGILNDQIVFRLVAVVRYDNSAIVREWQSGPFVETPAFTKTSRQQPRTKAQVPSIWHPGKKLIEKSQIGFAAYSRVYLPKEKDQLSQSELHTWEKGSVSELTDLLQAFYLAAFIDKSQHPYPELLDFGWPLDRNMMKLSGYLSYLETRTDVLPFLRIFWDDHHFDSSNWVPNSVSYYYKDAPNLRRQWGKPGHTKEIRIRRNINVTAHDRIEAALFIGEWFKDKISENEIKKLLG